MCVSLLYTRNEILNGDEEHHYKRLKKFSSWIFFHKINLQKYPDSINAFLIALFKIYDQISSPGCRYPSYIKKEILDVSLYKKIKNYLFYLYFDIFRPITFYKTDWIIYNFKKSYILVNTENIPENGYSYSKSVQVKRLDYFLFKIFKKPIQGFKHIGGTSYTPLFERQKPPE